MAGSDTIHRSRVDAQTLDVVVGRRQVGLEDRQPQPLVRQPPGELRQSAGPEQSDEDAVAHHQEVASPQRQRQHETMRGGQADHRHHAEHRQARYQHGNHEEGQAGHCQTEEGRSLDEREESGAQSLTRPASSASSAVCLHHHPCTHDASASLVAHSSLPDPTTRWQ